MDGLIGKAGVQVDALYLMYLEMMYFLPDVVLRKVIFNIPTITTGFVSSGLVLFIFRSASSSIEPKSFK